MPERLTARSPKNGLAYLVGVKNDEQGIEGSYNTLMCVRGAFEALATYEETVPNLQAENIRLKLQLEKVLESFGVADQNHPCPSTIGLNDSFECGLSIECPQCWRDALEAVGEGGERVKTGEMYTYALKNPKAKFKRLTHNEVFKLNEKGQLVTISSDESKTDYACPRIDEDWELVLEPVDFMTAAKAFSEGKDIYCESKEFGKREYSRAKGGRALVDDNGAAVSYVEILNGKWYIK